MMQNSNPLNSKIGGNMPKGNGGGFNIQSFMNIMNQMKGKDPKQFTQEYMKTNGISQEQLNQAKKMADEYVPQIAQFLKNFGK